MAIATVVRTAAGLVAAAAWEDRLAQIEVAVAMLERHPRPGAHPDSELREGRS